MVAVQPKSWVAADLLNAVKSSSAADVLASERARAAELSGFPNLPSRDSESWRKMDLSAIHLAESLAAAPARSLSTQAESPEGCAYFQSDSAEMQAELVGRLRALVDSRLESPRAHVFERLALALSSPSGILSMRGQALAPAIVTRTPPAVVGPHSHNGAEPQGNGSEGVAAHQCLVGHLAILVERGAEVTVVEELRSSHGIAPELWCTATDIDVADGARLNYILLCDFGSRELAFHDVRINLGRDAHAHVSMVRRGGLSGKTLISGILAQPGGSLRGIGIGTGRERQFHDMEIVAEHLAEHTESSLHYKTVLDDRAHSIFNGNLHVAPGLKHTQSRQINNNVLLSPRARAESMPNLVVRAEDVSAEHGATVGQLDREALFFLMSRGLPEPEARHLLIEGFIEEIVQEIPLAARRDEILLGIKKSLSLDRAPGS